MMTHKMMKIIGIAGAMVLITAVFAATISRVRASGAAAPVQETVAQIGNSFTYQGNLEDGGNPVNGSCDFQFSLFDAASSGTQIAFTIPKSNVAVNEGVFAVALDFGNVFTGDARYLEIAVSCPAGSGIFSTLNGRVALSATPYALSLRPGAVIRGAVAVTSTVQVINSNNSGKAYGVYGQTDSTHFDTAGVYGHATAATGNTSGVYGEANSNTGTGVFGFVGASSGNTSGVYGQVWSNEGVGVYGLGIITGTYGYANISSGVSYGVYGETESPSGYGIYSKGNAHVEGDLTWKETTSYLSIPAVALQPNDESIQWDVSLGGDSFYGNAANSSNYYYLAPVYLPHNATITEIKTWWQDSSGTRDATIILRRIDPGSVTDMVNMSTSGTGGIVISSSTSIVNPIVDNSQYAYILYVLLPDENINYYQTVITYTTTGPN